MGGPGGTDWPAQLPPRALSGQLPNTYSIYGLLECVKRLVLLNHSHRISMTGGNTGYLRGPGLMVCQSHRPWPDQQHTAWWTLASEAVWTKGCSAPYTAAPSATKTKEEATESGKDGGVKWFFLLLLFVCFLINICICILYFLFCSFFLSVPLVGNAKGVKGGYTGTGEISGIGAHNVKFPQSQ